MKGSCECAHFVLKKLSMEGGHSDGRWNPCRGNFERFEVGDALA
jgi:hypothetical protein